MHATRHDVCTCARRSFTAASSERFCIAGPGWQRCHADTIAQNRGRYASVIVRGLHRPQPHGKAAFRAKFEAASLTHAVLHMTSNGMAQVVLYDPPAQELLKGHAPALSVKSISRLVGSGNELGTARQISMESNYPGLLDADPGPAITKLALKGAQVQPALRQDAVRVKIAALSTTGRAARALHAEQCRAWGPDYVKTSQVVKDGLLIISGSRQHADDRLQEGSGAGGRMLDEDDSDLLPVRDLARLRSMLNAGLPTIAHGLHIVNPAELELE